MNRHQDHASLNLRLRSAIMRTTGTANACSIDWGLLQCRYIDSGTCGDWTERCSQVIRKNEKRLTGVLMGKW
jgi:hypothetical protein